MENFEFERTIKNNKIVLIELFFKHNLVVMEFEINENSELNAVNEEAALFEESLLFNGRKHSLELEKELITLNTMLIL